MGIIRAAVGDNIEEFDEDATLEEVWAFINTFMDDSNFERAIVLMDDEGQTHGVIWDSSLFYAHWETVHKMRAYLALIGFGLDG